MSLRFLTLCAVLLGSACVMGADLPETPAVQEALKNGQQALQRKSFSDAGEAFAEAVAAAEPAADQRQALVERAKDQLQQAIDATYRNNPFGAAQASERCMSAFWSMLAKRFAEDAGIRAAYLRHRIEFGKASLAELREYLAGHPDDEMALSRLMRSREASWQEDVQPVLIKQGTEMAVRRGLHFLSLNQVPAEQTEPFQQLVLEVMLDDQEMSFEAFQNRVDKLKKQGWTELLGRFPWPALSERYLQQHPHTMLRLVLAHSPEPWPVLARRLVERGDQLAVELGLHRLQRQPELLAQSDDFLDFVIDYADKQARSHEYATLLEAAKNLQITELEATVTDKLARAPDSVRNSPRIRRLRYGLGLTGTKQRVEALAQAYDGETLSPPVLPPAPELEQPPLSDADREKAAELERLPMPQIKPAGKEDAVLWQRLDTANDLLATYPGWGWLYRVNAETLARAGYRHEAILAITEGLRLAPTADRYDLRASLWAALGEAYRLPIIVDTHAALEQNPKPETLAHFCAVAVPDQLSVAGVVSKEWLSLVKERLMRLETYHTQAMNTQPELYLAAVRFWDAQDNLPRAMAATERLTTHAPHLARRYAKDLERRQKVWREQRSLRLFYGLPKAPAPHGQALADAIAAGSLGDGWAAYERWLKADPQAILPRLYAAAAFSDLDAPFLALATLEEAASLAPDTAAESLLYRVKAVCHAQLEEVRAAALAQAKATGEQLNGYWLTAFIEANQAAAFGRLNQRLDAASTATADLDAALAAGTLSTAQWWQFSELAAADERLADAAFGAACWLVSSEASDGDQVATAQARIAAYRDQTIAGHAREPFSRIIERDPTAVERLVTAYEDALEIGDHGAARDLLRAIWRCYGEERLDLQQACEVAAAAADWELLFSVSQAAVAQDPTALNREWYRLGQVASGLSSAAGNSPGATAVRQWSSLVSDRWQEELSMPTGGSQDALLKALAKLETMRFYEEKAASAVATTSYQRHADNYRKHVESLMPRIPEAERPHLAFMRGDLDWEAYQATFDHETDHTLAGLLRILRQWKTSGQAHLDEADYAEVQMILYDPQVPLHLRVMADRLLQEAGLRRRSWPVRASDALPLPQESMRAQDELRAGRLLQVDAAGDLLAALGGEVKRSFRQDVPDTVVLPTAPPILRVQIAPDLSVRTLEGLTAETFFEQMRTVARSSLGGRVEAVIAEFHAQMEQANSQEERHRAYAHLASAGRLGGAFYLPGEAWSDPLFAALKPYLDKHPEDAFVAAMDIPIKRDHLRELSEPAKQTIRLSAQATINAYRQALAAGDSSTTQERASLAISRLMTAFPPGSSQHNFALEKLRQGYSVDDIVTMAAEARKLPAEKLPEVPTGFIRGEEAAKRFQQAMKSGDMQTAADMAYTLRGEFFVRWALRDPSVRTDELRLARTYTRDPSLLRQLNGEIGARHAQARRSRRATSGYSSSSSSWNRFKAEMESKREASLQKQRERDLKNGVFRHKMYYD